MGLRSKHISDFIKKQSMGTSFFFCLKIGSHPLSLFPVRGVWLSKDCRCLFDWAVISAAQKQGRPHCGTDTQPLPRLFQVESKKKENSTKANGNQNSGELGSVSTQAGNNCGQSKFDRSSILHGGIVRSLLSVFGRLNKDERRSEWAKTVLIRSRKSMTQVLQNLRLNPLKISYQTIAGFDNWS